jgi:hypothetical protein
MDKPATDPVIWRKLRKKFKKLDDKEKTAPAGQWLRLHANPAPDSSPNDPRVVYQLDRGRDEHFPLEFTELAQKAGKALGFTCTLNAAFNAWVARVFADA